MSRGLGCLSGYLSILQGNPVRTVTANHLIILLKKEENMNQNKKEFDVVITFRCYKPSFGEKTKTVTSEVLLWDEALVGLLNHMFVADGFGAV